VGVTEKEMTRLVNGTGKLLPFVGMMVAMLTQSGSMVVIKVAMIDNINKYVMVVYTFALSTILLLPFALFLHRFSFSYMEANILYTFVSKFNTNFFCIILTPPSLSLPFSFSRSERPPLTFSALCSFFLLAFFGLVFLFLTTTLLLYALTS